MQISPCFPNQHVDSQVLHAYGVPQEDVLIKFNTTLNNFKNIKSKVAEEKRNCESDGVESSSVYFGIDKENKFALSVILYLQSFQTDKCTHCSKVKKYTKDYMITNKENIRTNQEGCVTRADRIMNSNKNNDEKILISNISLHYFKRHQDFGTPGSYRINPTQFCRVFNLGSTYLKENDPLFEVVKYFNWSEEQKAQKRLDDEALENLGSSSKEISNAFNNLVEHKDKTYRKVLSKDGRFEIDWTPCFSTTTCNLCEPEKEIGDGTGTITNVETKTSVKINGIWMHAVSQHGYYTINVNSRIEPQFAFNVLLGS